MTQRLALCRALLHDPALLVLDEPFTALDEDGAALLDRELAVLRRRGARCVLVDPRSRPRRAAGDGPAGARDERATLLPTSWRWRART